MIGTRHDRLCPADPRTDWVGKWIWVPQSAGYGSRNSYAFFRKTFSASGKLTVRIAADTRYELYLDGKRIERGTAPVDVAYQIFDTHTIEVDAGDHAIGVLVQHIGEPCCCAMMSRPGLLLEIASGSKVVAATDSSWKVLPGRAYKQDLPVLMSHFGFYEVCDFREIPEDWTDLPFDDSAWDNAEVVGAVGCEPWVRLIPRDIPILATSALDARKVVARGAYEDRSIRDYEPHATVAAEMAARERTVAKSPEPLTLPIRLGENTNEFVALDFGHEVTGHVVLGFEGAAPGQRVDVGFDERLDERGLPNPRRTYVHFAHRYFLRKGQDSLTVFGGHGFRYLLIDVPAEKGGLTISRVEVEERTYPVERTGSFRCSDEVLNELYDVGLLTTRLCMLDVYVDCPSR